MEHPQRISGLSTEAVGDGLAVLAGGQKYVLNATSALVFQHCDGRTSPEQLTAIVRQKFNLLPAEAEHLTRLALEELETSNLLQPAALPAAATFSRRQALSGFATLCRSSRGWRKRRAGLRWSRCWSAWTTTATAPTRPTSGT
jgi:hypothetical protein